MGKPLVKHNPLPQNRRANFPPGRRIGAIYCPQTTTMPQNKKLDFRFIPINPVFFAVRRFFKNFRGGVDVCKLPLRPPCHTIFALPFPRFITACSLPPVYHPDLSPSPHRLSLPHHKQKNDKINKSLLTPSPKYAINITEISKIMSN